MSDAARCPVPDCTSATRHRHTGRSIPAAPDADHPDAELWLNHARGQTFPVEVNYRPSPRSKVRTLGRWTSAEAAAVWMERTAAAIRQGMAQDAEAEAAGVPWAMLP